MTTSQFFSAPLRGNNEWWRYLLTFFIVLIFMLFIGNIPFGIFIGMKVFSGDVDQEDIADFTNNMNFEALGISSNAGVAMLLLSFAISLVGLWLCVKFFHSRPLRSLINGLEKIRWSRVFFAFGLWLLFSIITEAASYFLSPELYSFNFNPSSFIVLLLISLTLIPLQTSFEELLFRGYLMQGIGSSGIMTIVPLVVTSLGFGAMHIMNPEVGEFGFGTMMLYYCGSGLFLGIMTIMDDGLELALGTHAATNFFASTCVTFDKAALQTDALFKVEQINITAGLIGFAVLSVLFLFICSKKYNWSNWNKLIDEPVLAVDNASSEEHFTGGSDQNILDDNN